MFDILKLQDRLWSVGSTYLTYVYLLSLCSFVLFRFLIYFISFCVICVATQWMFIVLLFSAYTIGCTSVATTNTRPTLTPSHMYNWRFDCFSAKTRETTVVSLADPQNIEVIVKHNIIMSISKQLDQWLLPESSPLKHKAMAILARLAQPNPA